MIPLTAAAQVRSVPARTAVSPLTGPLGFPVSTLPAPSLNTSLAAPSLGATLTAIPSAPRLALAAPQTAVSLLSNGPVAALAAKPLATSAALAALPPQAKFTVEGTRSEAVKPEQNLNALFDGVAPRRDAAATPDQGPAERRGPLLSPSNVRRARTIAAISVPLAAGAAVFGAVAPHLALQALQWLGQGAYWLANPFAFAFTIPQIYMMLARRSASVSTSMITVGLLATAAMAVNMAFDGKDLMMYRNLAQAGGFAVMLLLKYRFARRPASALPSRNRASLETAAVVVLGTAVLFFGGPVLAAAVGGFAAMGGLLVPIQIVSGFGFTYLMYAQLTKMAREHSAGDSSPAMMWAYLGTKTIWLWSFATMMSLATGPAWIALSLGALFIGACWFAGQAALSHLLHSPWSFLPKAMTFAGRSVTRDTLADGVAFVALSALILALSGGGWLAFHAFLGVPAADGSRFRMYLLYTVQSLVACLATLRTLRMRASFDKK